MPEIQSYVGTREALLELNSRPRARLGSFMDPSRLADTKGAHYQTLCSQQYLRSF
jgi:hypothetical protein